MAKLNDTEIRDLDQDGHSDLANAATDNEISADKLKSFSKDRLSELQRELDKMRIQDATKSELKKHLEDAILQKAGGAAAPVTVTQAPPAGPPPLAIQPIADRAFATIDAKIKTMNPDGSHMSTWRALWKVFPGTEPTIDPTADDIKQVINQSRQWNRELLNGLAKEYNDSSSKLPVNWLNSNLPGWFPTLKQNHNFDTDGYKGQSGVNAKRLYIVDVIGEIEKAWQEADKGIIAGPSEWAGDKLIALFVWGFLPITSTLFAGKLIYNIAHKKPDPLEAARWAADKTWQGTKKAATLGASAVTTGYKSVNGKFATKVEAKDLKDTPAYTADEWAKERARLEETTRRMIYMDSGVNPRHNPNATAAEIFRDVEGTPALKTAYDARMVKLTELGNTLVGQDKYLSQEAFNKEASKIVAGDIKEASIKGAILKRVPFTAERSDYKQTQEALKKVKGEIDNMRARLTAKATMDGVEIPKVLEAQLQAFENAHKAAYEADLSLDKSRNQIARVGDRINAINEVIAHFEEINTLEGKITDVKTKITEVETRIKTQREAAHSENPVEQRQREADGKQGEIDAANRERDRAIGESDTHETAKREAVKDKRLAEQAVKDEEARIRKDISDRKAVLQDQITKNSGDATKTAAVNKWQDELDGKEGKVKELNEQLTPPHTGSTLVAKNQAVQDAQEAHDKLIAKDAAVQRKITDADSKITRLAGEKNAILSRATGADAKSLTTTDKAELDELKAQKSGLEEKVKEAKAKIDALATKPENKGFPRSTGGTLVQAQAELARLDAIVAPGGTLDVAKTTAKTTRNTAFTNLNTALVNLNTESARLGAGLEVKMPHIGEFVKGQGFSEDISLREHGATGDKAADQKLKGTRPKVIETIMKRGK